ncbi:AIPR family protein [Sandaracinobacter sp. RS1-74]|uniref:AIPR family protein n=1 Tax=Sandaracinobacteroides sayramensis TaxID=2913411 RepID=UPI001EDA4240|nr:AIPR family protein [Sandaracinobacteroides sayramensis]
MWKTPRHPGSPLTSREASRLSRMKGAKPERRVNQAGSSHSVSLQRVSLLAPSSQRSSRGHKEALNIDFVEMFGDGINCLPANLGSDSYQSFLIVMPAPILAKLYDRYSARLLEQNVRTFLQARAQVNKGIRATILTEPQMFFAYNNGITATAQEVETRLKDGHLQIVRMTDLQIVNGGQTTASLFHTQRKDKADLSGIFVQMKLSVIDSEQSEMIVPRISEYANTQNRVNAADFFSNHPFHVRMADFSRRIWAPAQQGAQRETKWFYERARGQYIDAQSKLTPAEQKRFKAEYPKPQMFTKTDLAKFENVFDDHPKWVNLGGQKNFARYALRIGREWEKSSNGFNELYFKRAIARGILFRATEKLVSAQPWYNGGYRANIVAYTLAVLGDIAKKREASVDFQQIWAAQAIDQTLTDALAIIAAAVNEDIIQPPQGISNISEWAKKEGCWTRLTAKCDEIADSLSEEFLTSLVSGDETKSDAKDAKRTQKIDNGIEAQRQIIEIPGNVWQDLRGRMTARRLLTPKEIGIMNVAAQLPGKVPSEKQCVILMEILDKAREEGLHPRRAA